MEAPMRSGRKHPCVISGVLAWHSHHGLHQNFSERETTEIGDAARIPRGNDKIAIWQENRIVGMIETILEKTLHVHSRHVLIVFVENEHKAFESRCDKVVIP